MLTLFSLTKGESWKGGQDGQEGLSEVVMRATTILRQMLQEPGIIAAPGAYDCLTAKIIQQAGFPAVYMTGAGTSVSRLGYPDLALATASEMIANAAEIVAAVDVPVIADADTGYGGVLNVQRTIRQYERAGVAAVRIEDQEFPKRCGHLDNKRVVPVADMSQKIRAAVDARTDEDFVIIVRTDALAVTGWDDTMRRCEEYIKAGPTLCSSRPCGRLKRCSK
jgi:2-methylisocitrate lyase-like PEP mutase family enzyme